MAQTPSSIRMNLKPSSSPYYNYTRSPSTRSPVKISGRYDIPGGLTLALKQAIGTTTESANALDSFPAARSFAFTAGAAAVIATLGDDDELVTQRFYRARPTATPLNHYASPYVPSTPTAGLGDGRTVSPFGSPAPDWADSPSNRTWTARERVKAATCVSYSLCGKYLAVGETGYKPRVLIFSTSKDAPSDIPLTCMSDHTFGVKCMAFSSDSQYLATLGAANDGFLYVWSINSKNGSATLFASNKCTSNINTIAWIGSRLVTVGTRHVKVWRVDDPQTTLSGSSQTGNMTHKMLPGRNCVLGPLLDANFMCIGEIAPGKAIVCSERGEVCLLDDSTGNQLFRKIADAGLNVASMTADSGRLYIAGDQGRVKTLAISSLLATSSSSPSPIPFEESLMVAVACESTSINAIACLSNRLVTVDSRHAIRISHLDSSEEVGDTLHRLPAHSEAVLGVHALAMPNVKNAAFLTWSADGTVLFWDQNGICKHEMQVNLQSSEVNEDMANELRVVRAYSGAEAIVCGDKHGSLWIFETAESSTTHSVSTLPAHHGEITDVAVYESDEITYLASSGRDRTVQVFWRTDGRWELLQTLDEHIGAVTKVLFANNGQRLFSSSSDRTVVVRGRASREEEGIVLNAFLIQRTITLKATPTSITLDCDQEDILLVATIDRHIHRYDCRTGLVINNFRSADSEGGDAVALASIKKTRGMPIIVGVSSTDKSIRLYDESGTLLSRDWGHTEGITDVALIKGLGDTEEQGQRQLVTVAIDGTIFIWNLTIRASGRHDLTRSMDLMGMESISKDVLSSRPPLRKVLSQSELARFQNSNEEGFYAIPTDS